MTKGVLASVVLAWSGAGHATEHATQGDEFVQFRWQRDASAQNCPAQAQLEQRVVAKLGRNPFLPRAARALDASVSFANGLWHVELLVREGEGPVQGQRVFDVREDAESCDRVADAVGLAVALAIDPRATEQSPRPSLAAQPAYDVAHSNAEPRSSAPVLVMEDKHPTPARPPLVLPRIVCAREPADWAMELSLRGLGANGLLPDVALGVGMFGTVGRGAFRAALEFSYFPEKAQGPDFSFGLSTVGAGLCGKLVGSPSVVGGWCGVLHVGAMHGVVNRLVPLQPGDRMFVALSTGPKLEWRLSSALFVEGAVSAWIPLQRPVFALRGVDEPVFQSRAISAVGLLGVGWRTK